MGPDSLPGAAQDISMSLFTDLYELTMAQAYWQSGVTGEACFSMFARRLPTNRGYLLFAGLEDMLDALNGLRFGEGDIASLRSMGLFDEGFLEYLAGLRFTGGARAMPEATVFFANEPVLEVTAPIIEAQVVETLLLNLFNTHTMLATKAARVVEAAEGRTVVDFAARRTQGIDAAIKLARAAYIAGFAGTSNVLAAKRYGISAVGTMAHSFITSFDSELEAFDAYAASFPDNSTFLVDTYDTVAGVHNAVVVAKRMRERGARTENAIRLGQRRPAVAVGGGAGYAGRRRHAECAGAGKRRSGRVPDRGPSYARVPLSTALEWARMWEHRRTTRGLIASIRWSSMTASLR